MSGRSTDYFRCSQNRKKNGVFFTSSCYEVLNELDNIFSKTMDCLSQLQ